MAKIIDNYILLESICQGTFGEIHKGRNLVSKEAVAVKTVQLEQFLSDPVLRDMIVSEIQALKKLEDPRIIRMIKMLKSSNNIYLIYEFLQGRNLKRLLSERGRFIESEAMDIFTQICQGFARLQKEKIIKRNLNSHNVHVIESADSPQQYEIKLKNFFYSKTANQSSAALNPPSLFEEFHYLAPEILSQRHILQNQESLSDVFSAGVVLFEMVCGSLPFEKYANSIEDLIEFYANNDLADVIRHDLAHLSPQTQHLLRRMILVNPEQRISWDDIFRLLPQRQSLHRDKISPERKSFSKNGNNFENIQNQNIANLPSSSVSLNRAPQRVVQESIQDNEEEKSSNQEIPGEIKSRNKSSDNRQKQINPNSKLIQNAQNIVNNKPSSINQGNTYTPPIATVSLMAHKQPTLASHLPNPSSAEPLSQQNLLSASSKLNHQKSEENINGLSKNAPLTYKREHNASSQRNESVDKRKEYVEFILDEIMEKRSKIQVILGGLDSCMEQEEWSLESVNVYSCGYILLQKACVLSDQLLAIFETPEKALAHFELTPTQFQEWLASSKKLQIKMNIMRENMELKNNIMRFQEDFAENIDARVILESSQPKRKDTQVNEQALNTILFQASKELSQISMQQKNRKSLVLAHFLADIACIDIMYNKFLGKKRFDVLNHPYFKKLTEISRDKLQENLDNKFKLYDYHRISDTPS